MTLVDQIRKRIDWVLDEPASMQETHGEATPPGCVEPLGPTVLAEAMAERITALVKALVERYYRQAVLERSMLGEHFPFGQGAVPNGTNEHLLRTLALLQHREHSLHGGVKSWPKDVSVLDVIRALERTGDKRARYVAQQLRATDMPITTDAFDRTWIGPAQKMEPDNEGLLAIAQWPPLGCAVILTVEHAVREDARRKIVPVSASRRSRAAAAVVSQGSRGPWDPVLKHDRQKLKVVLQWNGAPRSSQLAIPDQSVVVGQKIEEDLVCAILDELHADGLRDWIVLHRMAAEQGRGGAFVWSWKEHRDRTAYARRIAANNLTDSQARTEVMSRLWKLQGAELWELIQEYGIRERWLRVGNFGLIDIPLIERDRGEVPDLAGIVINPALYAGAAKGAAQYFALLPNEVLELDGPTLRLATLVAFEMRYARDQGGCVTLKAATLWEFANVRGGVPEPKRWAESAETLHRSLDDLVQAGVVGAWSKRDPGEVTAATRYELHPAPWWRDQVVHGVPPEMGPSHAKLPHTGEELKTWRKKRGWSQAELAQRLKVGLATIKRAEQRPTEPLGPLLAEALPALKDEPEMVELPAPGIPEKGSKR